VRITDVEIGGPARLAANADRLQHANKNPSGDFGLIGLAVMGQNLILNAADHGVNVVAFNRTVSKVDHFLENEAKGKQDSALLC